MIESGKLTIEEIAQNFALLLGKTQELAEAKTATINHWP